MSPAAAAAPTVVDDTDASGAALGLAPEVIAQLRTRAIEPPPDAEAADDTATAPACAVWPCNAPAVALFEAMLTQWRVGPAGISGLDYAVLPGAAQSRGIAPRRAWRLLPELQVMEDETLLLFATQARAAASAPATDESDAEVVQ
jgi:hypothetical protein